jgi:hypothetical protein
MRQLTEDHSLVQELVSRGVLSEEEARTSPRRNVITRALGTHSSVRVDSLCLDVLPRDRFLLCSDGLHEYLQADDVEHMLADSMGADIPTRLVDLANERGGKDNISAVWVQVTAEEEPAIAHRRRCMECAREAPLFRYLNYRELVALMNLTKTRTVSPGETIVQEGEPGEMLYVLLEGEARVVKGGHEIARLPKGSHFGEMSLFTNAPRWASAIAVGPVRLLTLGRDPFFEFIRREQTPGIKLMWSFLQAFTRRLQAAGERLIEVQDELPASQVIPRWIRIPS